MQFLVENGSDSQRFCLFYSLHSRCGIVPRTVLEENKNSYLRHPRYIFREEEKWVSKFFLGGIETR
jgi:hypothetical protein